MMKAYFRIMVVLAVAILSVTPALADTWDVGDITTCSLSQAVSTPYGSGGLFTITNTNTGDVIYTFSLELNEPLYPNDQVAGISGEAVRGRGGPSPDSISSSTDWLYAQYIGGSAEYSDPAALQIAFWLLEEEVSLREAYNLWSRNPLLSLAVHYVQDALGHNEGSYGTQVLNLGDAAGNPHQSYLIFEPLIFQPVPEPSLMVLLGISVLSLAGLKRWWKE